MLARPDASEFTVAMADQVTWSLLTSKTTDRFAPLAANCATSVTPSLRFWGSLMLACGGVLVVSGGQAGEHDVVMDRTAGEIAVPTLNGADVAGAMVWAGTTLVAVATSV